MVTAEAVVVTVFPVIFLILLFGGGALYRRKNIDMDGKPPINKVLFYASKYSIVIIWGAMVLQSWGISIALGEVPVFVTWISLILWIFGFILLFLGRFELGNSFRLGTPREDTSLKVSGLYRISRNPMYLGVYATVIASVLYTVNPVVIFLGVCVIAIHHKIVLAEEEYMQSVFGQEYREYSRRVRRYI
jgi:protein-S-isoprenylcysteine O-methyltransferase Ste14